MRIANEDFRVRERKKGSLEEIQDPAFVVICRQGCELTPSVGDQKEREGGCVTAEEYVLEKGLPGRIERGYAERADRLQAMCR